MKTVYPTQSIIDELQAQALIHHDLYETSIKVCGVPYELLDEVFEDEDVINSIKQKVHAIVNAF